MSLFRRNRKRKRGGMSRFKAGAIGIALIVVFSYLAYTKFANPFASKFTVHAVFANANGLRPQSFVRIAGVNVGTVQSVGPVAGCKHSTDPTCQQAEVTMVINPDGLPLHDDATFAIRPRIFLEGNFFVDISPGSPSAPTVKAGHTFPINQGTEPVQFDQVLTSLQQNTRKNLQLLLKGYGTAVKKGGPSYNASIKYWLPAYEYSAVVAHDALGIQPHDLSNWIAQQGTVAGAVDAHPQNLKSLITDFNTTAGAFARQQANLQSTLQELPRTLAAATPAFNALNAAFPPLRALSRALIPGVKSTGPTVDVSLPFISQLRQLVQPSELRGLTADLSKTVPALTKLTVKSIPLYKNGVRPASSCVANVIYPWSQLTINDKHFNASNGFPPRKAYIEAVNFLPGVAGESRNFDANGPYIRILGALGNTVTQSLSDGLVGGALQPITGAEPSLPPGGKRPPLQPNVPCETQPAITTLDDAGTSAAPSPIKVPVPLPLVKKRAAVARQALIDEMDTDLKASGVSFKTAGSGTSNAKKSGN
jgi:phospholipid/cholesterol/gamma-HCH transport system substrate-binding protein